MHKPNPTQVTLASKTKAATNPMKIQRKDFGNDNPSYLNLNRTNRTVAPTLTQIRINAHIAGINESRNIGPESLHVFSSEVDKVIDLNNVDKKRRAIQAGQQALEEQLRCHIQRYKVCRRILSIWVKTGRDESDMYSTPWLSVKLKHSHIFWCFRNFYVLETLKQQIPQQDLFAF